MKEPRSLDYFVLRTCERLRMTEPEFWRAEYVDQVRWLAYDGLRRCEEMQGSS